MTARLTASCASLAITLMIASAPNTSANEPTPRRITSGSTTKLLFAPANNKQIDGYIQARHSALDQLAQDRPNERMGAQISYKHYLSGKELIALFNRYSRQKFDLIPIALSFGWQDQRAEYQLQPNEALPEALDRASASHAAFIKTLYESAVHQHREQAALGGAASDLRQYDEFLAHAKELKQVYETKGVRYYGIKVDGTVSNLKLLRDTDAAVRLVDPLWDAEAGVFSPSIRKHAVPISPDQKGSPFAMMN